MAPTNSKTAVKSIILMLILLSSATVVQAQEQTSFWDDIISGIKDFFGKLSLGSISGGNGCYAEYGWRAGRGASVIYNADGVEIGYVDPTTVDSVGAYMWNLDRTGTGVCATKVGTVIITTTPTDGILYIDEVYSGIAPQTIKKVPGKYLVRAVKDGYPDKAVVAEIILAQTTKVGIHFIPILESTPVQTPVLNIPCPQYSPPYCPGGVLITQPQTGLCSSPPICITPAATEEPAIIATINPTPVQTQLQVLNPVETTAAPTSTPSAEIIQTQPGVQGTAISPPTPPVSNQPTETSEDTKIAIVVGAILLILVLIIRLTGRK